MDLSAYFGVVATVEFALLGLWWIAVQGRPDLRSREADVGRMAYLVSLQFVVPGTASLLAQIAPTLTIVWQISFALAGLTGVIAIIILVPTLKASGSTLVARWLRFGAIPVYVVMIVISAVANGFPANATFGPLQIEGVLFAVVIFLSAQVAWAAAMAPDLKLPHQHPAYPNQATYQAPPNR